MINLFYYLEELYCKQAGFTIISDHQVSKFVSYAIFSVKSSLYNKFVGKALNKAGTIIPKDFSFYISAFDIICVYAVKDKPQEKIGTHIR